MLTESQMNIIIIVLLFTIVVLLLTKNENFNTTCKNGQCFECKDDNYRNNYCYQKPVTRVCPDGYQLNTETLMCDKTVVSENKLYTVTARPTYTCDENQIQVGDSCVTEAKYYFKNN
jgi:hypothetical protein